MEKRNTTISTSYYTTGKVYVNDIIHEYDIAAAGLSALKTYFGKELWENLEKMDKNDRNIRIGYMMRDDNGINQAVTNGIRKAREDFIENNNLRGNVLDLTKDSVTIRSKIPRTISIGEFKFKAASFSTYISFKSAVRSIALYYDNITDRLRLKGLPHDPDHPFIKFLKDVISSIEACIEKKTDLIKTLSRYRKIYLSKGEIGKYGLDIYRSLVHNDRFLYKMGDQAIETDSPIPDKEELLIISDNFEVFLGIMLSVLKKYN
jgi:hypothetical protein